jgi:vancomycin resistance protein YoaR
VAPIRQAAERKPVPATFRIKDRQPVITPEVNGITIVTRKVLAALEHADSIEVPLTEVPPEVTTASIKEMGIRKVIAEWSTQYDPSIPRGENVERAARAFNGLVIKPGELLSYNGVVGPVDAENGWKEAWVFENGQVVTGVGGGVCQVATTFYGAALRAGLEIMERHPHQLAVSYIEPSQDAAIAPGYEDLKIRNTTAGYIYVETESGGGRVTFRLYGDAPDGQEIKIESKVLGSRPFTTRYQADSSLKPGQQVVSVAGHAGLVSEAYRAVYQDGKLVKRDLLSRDSYLPTNAVILTGPSGR